VQRFSEKHALGLDPRDHAQTKNPERSSRENEAEFYGDCHFLASPTDALRSYGNSALDFCTVSIGYFRATLPIGASN